MQNFILSCDWGTSSFRLRLVDVRDRHVLGEVLSQEGAADTFNRWKICSGHKEISKEQFYAEQLHKNIHTLSDKVAIDLAETPVVVSGMACSSIGIKELPYASIPFSLDGSDAFVHRLDAANDFPNDVWLVSGVSNHQDVMRGEETQVIGLASVEKEVLTANDITCILPGTHSKHVRIKNGHLVDFQTYMTGELFYILTHHSILKDSVVAGSGKLPLTETEREAFSLGIEQSSAADVLHTLFSVRVNQLFQYLTKEENYFYLSGLLIGAELRSLLRNGSRRVMLCSGSNIYHLYELAIGELNLMEHTAFIVPETMDKVAIEGQIKIFQNYRD